jgi:hypothetical protein
MGLRSEFVSTAVSCALWHIYGSSRTECINLYHCIIDGPRGLNAILALSIPVTFIGRCEFSGNVWGPISEHEGFAVLLYDMMRTITFPTSHTHVRNIVQYAGRHWLCNKYFIHWPTLSSPSIGLARPCPAIMSGIQWRFRAFWYNNIILTMIICVFIYVHQSN